jgi:hypothetical protein
MGERPDANGGGLHGASSGGPGYGAADPVGGSPGRVLPSLGALREPQSRSDRHERQLCWGCRKRRRLLSRRFARALSHRAKELRSGHQPGQKRRPRPGQQLYVKVVSLESWGSGLAGTKNIWRDTFYAWLIPPEVAQAEIAPTAAASENPYIAGIVPARRLFAEPSQPCIGLEHRGHAVVELGAQFVSVSS